MATRHPAIQEFLDKLANMAGMNEPTAKMLLEGSGHPRKCRCSICLEWWLACGPEHNADSVPSWGPFTVAEIEAARKAAADDSVAEGH